MKITFECSIPEAEFENLKPPDVSNDISLYAKFIEENSLDFSERLILILALIPHIKPSCLDVLYLKNNLYDVPFTELGGMRNDKYKGYLPTGETAIFLLAGSDFGKRFELLHLFGNDHFFSRKGILSLTTSSLSEPLLNGVISLSRQYITLFTSGEDYKLDFSSNFPAKLIYTEQGMEDFVVYEELRVQLLEIQNFLKHGSRLKNEFEFGKKIQPGFKALFTGPPGTGKTMAVCLLGKENGLDVYKVDLSMVVSKYIGETEKNLSRVFDQAETRGWILFFDEADALFGKRSNISDAHDRYANQEVSYLLQRMESFDGLVILCSNFNKNIDAAFFRRFQLVLDFTLPNAHQRLQLWNQSLTSEFEYAADVDVDYLAEQYELSGASIINSLHYAMLKCLERGDNIVQIKDLLAGIKIEFIKERKSIL